MKIRLALAFFSSLLSTVSTVYADFDQEEELLDEPTAQSFYPLLVEDLDEDLYDDDFFYGDDALADAEEDTTTSYESDEAPHQRPFIEAKAGYFFFTDHHMNRIYKHGGPDVQLSGSYPLYQDFIHIYASIEYLQATGHSRPLHHKTSLWDSPSV